MSNTFEEFQSGWNKSREAVRPNTNKLDQLINSAKSRQRSNLVFHYGNIVVLLVTVVVLVIVWQVWMPFQEQLSIIGIGIMIGGLVLRIILEAISAVKSRKINLFSSTKESNQDVIRFYQFRKTMHGPVTIFIIIAYLVGYVIILPELSRYLSTVLLAVFTGAFLLSGLFIIYKVRQSIRKEMDNLRFFLTLDKELNE